MIGPGNHFGELAMITREPRTATITAETPLRCLTIRFWDFREFAKANPDVSWNLLQHLGCSSERPRLSLSGRQPSGRPS